MTTILLDDLDYDDDFEYYGLKFHSYPEYKLIYKINSLLDIKLERVNDLDISLSNQIFCYSVYCLNDLSTHYPSYLIKNKSHDKKIKLKFSLFEEVNSSNYLIDRFKNYDYILKLNINLTLSNDIPLSLRSAGISILVDNLELKDREKKLLYL